MKLSGTVDSITHDPRGLFFVVRLKEYPNDSLAIHILKAVDGLPSFGDQITAEVDADGPSRFKVQDWSKANDSKPQTSAQEIGSSLTPTRNPASLPNSLTLVSQQTRPESASKGELIRATRAIAKPNKNQGRVEYVDLNALCESSWNPNEMESETFQSLVDDMRDGGFYVVKPIDIFPIAVDSKGIVAFQIADGHNRFRAAKELKWGKIRAEILDMDEAQAKAWNYRKNRERGTLNPEKEGALFLADWKKGTGHLTEEEIAEKYGVDVSTVSRRMSILPLAKTGIKPSHAEEIAQTIKEPEVQRIVARVAAKKKLSPNQTATLARSVADRTHSIPNLRADALRAETESIAKQIKSQGSGVKATRPDEVAAIIHGARSQSVQDFATGDCPWCGKPIKWTGGHKFAKGK